MVYAVDLLQSEIIFTVKLLNTKLKGTFESYQINLPLESVNALADATINIEIDVASLNTNEPLRDQHLKSADFFYTDLYPKIYFTKTDMQKITEHEYLLTGLITIKNITKELVFTVIKKTTPSLLFICTAIINRNDFDLVYNPVFEKVNLLDSNVHIEVQVAISH